jgi:hypothetical protein
MMRRFAMMSLPVLLVSILVGCGPSQTPIPPGAQQLHVVVKGDGLRLTPATTRAGDVYVVLDTPGSSVGFVQRQHTATETPGPFSDDDLERLARGDSEGAAIGGFDDSGCSAEQRAEGRGRIGPCGNAFKIVLFEGKYVFFTGNLEDRTAGDYSGSIAVLEVVP